MIRKYSLEKLLEKVYTEPNSGCWLWSGQLTKVGYGDTMCHTGIRAAHRLSYFYHYGEFDQKLHVLHKCDVKSCVNPAHLYLGTNDDNCRDKAARNRYQLGEKHHISKLTDWKVLEIREKYARGLYTQQNLADEYGVNQVTIFKIVNRKNWVHI